MREKLTEVDSRTLMIPLDDQSSLVSNNLAFLVPFRQ
jgi:hypothetical protein